MATPNPRGPLRHDLGKELLGPGEWGLLSKRFGLSKRESQLARRLLDGASEKVTAGELNLSVHTVHAYVRRIYGRLGVRTRQELTLLLAAALRSEVLD
jgi:DNA-binding CsgD family transcriptional regulator